MIQNRLVITGMGNKDKRNYFIFNKNKDFFPIFLKLLNKLEIKKTGSFYDYEENQNINLEELVDVVEHMSNKNYDIDLFFGKDKIIAVIRTKENRKKLIDIMKEFIEFES